MKEGQDGSLGVNMDVKVVALSLPFLLVACAEKKSVESVALYKTGDQTVQCPSESLLKNQFVVQYEDGRVEVYRSENEAVFEKSFIEPNLKEIKKVEYDSIVSLRNPSTDSSSEVRGLLTNEDWGQAMVRAPQVWQQGVLGEGVTVAVIDTAVDITHPQLKNQLWQNQAEINGQPGVDDDKNGYVDDFVGWDFIANTSPTVITNPEDYHGSHVAGIIAADAESGTLSGVAPKAKILQASFLNETNGSIGAAIKAIQYASANGAKIINASWGGPRCSSILRDEIEALGKKNVLFVAASGNEFLDYDRMGPDYYMYPAVFNFAHMLSVAASDIRDFLTDFSNKSFTLVHIGAPGDQIRSTVPKISHSSGYLSIPGTSMAAPFVSGSAALLWSAKPNATAVQIRQAILNSVDARNYKVSSQGRLNVEKALAEIRRVVP